MAELERLQKYIAACGVASRRAAEELILNGKVKVNDQIVTKLGTKIDPGHDKVQVRNKIISTPERGILLLHKPRGVVSTLDDPQGRPTVASYLTKHYRSYYPVGRLDYDSSGLVILTNDGELAERLMHPRYGIRRVYEARVAGVVTDKTIQRLRSGINLEDGRAVINAEIMRTDEDATWLSVTIAEGRNRLIRRVMERVFHPVQKLRRISHGPLKLGKLQSGQVRKLTEKEYRQIKSLVMRLSDNAQASTSKPKVSRRISSNLRSKSRPNSRSKSTPTRRSER